MERKPFRIAAAQYDIGYFAHIDEYRAKARRWIDEAAGNGARLLLLPEYASMELASLFPREVQRALPAQLRGMQDLLDEYLGLYAELARTYRVYIQPGTFPVRLANGQYRNRAYFFHPDGRHEYQEKLQMTRFESERWLIDAGEELKVFDTAFGRVAISVCYDVEFPLLARRQVEAGAELILVPSCTDTLAGYHRVRVGCQARALENQCYVVQSSTVGEARWSEAVDVNVGAAGIYTPIDYGFPDDGVLAAGELNRPGWVYGDLDLDKIAHVREAGQVFNFRDWTRQLRF
ncbi:MAG TPA: carbon-nitrogen hydrolase family protein [Burkholderiales bacterium]